MSHSKERTEKICLNCKTDLFDRFCHVCGQENIEPRQSLWGLITHFFHDITHFDGKFFETGKWLIRKPGFLSKEYVSGRRASYLNPVRMYVFTSAFFFILFFSFFFDTENFFVKVDESPLVKADSPEDLNFVTQRDTSSPNPGGTWKYKPALPDSAYLHSRDSLGTGDSSNLGQSNPAKGKDKSAQKSNKGEDEEKKDSISFKSSKYENIAEYEAAQKALPEGKRDNWFERMLAKREIEVRPKYEKDWRAANKELLNKFMHYFPQLLFISLPLIASVLMLIYIRRRKEYYYVSHCIFLIHVYIYSFLNLIIFFTLSKIKSSLDWGWISWLQFILFAHAVWYVYKAMRVFYKQGRGKTLLKFVVLNLLTFFILGFLFMGFLLLSFWNM